MFARRFYRPFRSNQSNQALERHGDEANIMKFEKLESRTNLPSTFRPKVSATFADSLINRRRSIVSHNEGLRAWETQERLIMVYQVV